MDFRGKQITVRDKRGIEVQAGDLIAMGFRSGNSGEIRLGTILEYLEYDQTSGKPNCYLKIQWMKIDQWTPEKPTRISVNTETNIPSGWSGTEYWKHHEFVKVLLPDEAM